MKKLVYLFILVIWGCKQDEKVQQTATSSPYEDAHFSEYWDQGMAELNNYELTQYRYGQERKGHAVLIFVTEDFSEKKQVKLDNPSSTGDDAVHIMKMNFTKKFITGVYPYSMMTSVFTPLESTYTPLKTTTTSQEWCGHTYTQLNKTQTGYDVQSYSYFEKEGDKKYSVNKSVVLEDAIWNLIRIAPDELPQGDVMMLPGVLYQRLSHQPLQPVKSQCRSTVIAYTKNGSDSLIRKYIIKQPSLDRMLVIDFDDSFPYKILRWEETATGIDGETYITTGQFKAQIMLDYWNHNSLSDSVYRDSLLLK